MEYGNAPSSLGVFQAFRKGRVCSEELVKTMLFTQNKNPKAFLSRFLGRRARGRVEGGAVAASVPGCGFLGGFAAGGDGSWMVGPDEPSGAFWGKNPPSCFICPDPRSLPPKKPFGEKIFPPSLKAASLRHFFLLSCLRCLSDATGFSHPFSRRMPESGRRVGAREAPPGSQQQ